MTPKSMHQINIEFIKPGIAVLMAWGISLTDVADTVKLLSACVALGYGVWKWVSDAKKK